MRKTLHIWLVNDKGGCQAALKSYVVAVGSFFPLLAVSLWIKSRQSEAFAGQIEEEICLAAASSQIRLAGCRICGTGA